MKAEESNSLDSSECFQMFSGIFGKSYLQGQDPFPYSDNLVDLVQELYTSLSKQDCFQTMLQNAVSQPYKNNLPWVWYPLIEQQNLSAGLMAIEMSSSIPLHDHPGSHGIQRVIYGDVRIRQFDIKKDTSMKSGVVELEFFKDQILEVGDYASYGPETGNIHGFSTHNSRCVLLNVSFPCTDRKPRSIYFLHSNVGSTIFANRIDKDNLNLPTVRRVA